MIISVFRHSRIPAVVLSSWEKSSTVVQPAFPNLACRSFETFLLSKRKRISLSMASSAARASEGESAMAPKSA